jgi:hypothetical protein
VRDFLPHFDAPPAPTLETRDLHFDLEDAVFERCRGGLRIGAFRKRHDAVEAAITSLASIVAAFGALFFIAPFARDVELVFANLDVSHHPV